MSMDKMTRSIIKDGHWRQCSFCQRVLPTREWRDSDQWKGRKDEDCIEPDGKCTTCQSYKG